MSNPAELSKRHDMNVAALSGFASETHFIRIFRRATGLHPDAWRAQLK
jgi:AraC-like DNA-binding protein